MSRFDRKPVIVLSVLALYAIAGVYAWRVFAPSDDTYIYLVYAKNFLKGNGLTYNGMRVQGFTSALWEWLIVLVGETGVRLPTAANILSALSGLLTLATTCALVRVMGVKGWKALAALLIVALTGDFAFYMGNGLETVFFTGMTAWSVTYLFRGDAVRALGSWGLPFVLAVTALARPEGIAVALFVLFVLLIESRRVRFLLRTLAIMLVIVIVPFVWAQVYYGHWIPNTFYAKGHAGFANLPQGLRYLRNFLAGNIVLMLIFLFPLAGGLRSLDRTQKLIYSGVGLWWVYVTFQGGDNMVGYRALLPVIPLMGALVVYSASRINVRGFAFGLVMLCGTHFFVYNSGYAIGSSWQFDVKFHAEQWRLILQERIDCAYHLKATLPPNSLIALNAAGTIPYYSELPTIDMLGLNNERIARYGSKDYSLPYGHQCGDGYYVINQKPAAIMFSGMGTVNGDYYLSDRQISASPDFLHYYFLEELPHSHAVYIRDENRARRVPRNLLNPDRSEQNKR